MNCENELNGINSPRSLGPTVQDLEASCFKGPLRGAQALADGFKPAADLPLHKGQPNYAASSDMRSHTAANSHLTGIKDESLGDISDISRPAYNAAQPSGAAANLTIGSSESQIAGRVLGNADNNRGGQNGALPNGASVIGRAGSPKGGPSQSASITGADTPPVASRRPRSESDLAGCSCNPCTGTTPALVVAGGQTGAVASRPDLAGQPMLSMNDAASTASSSPVAAATPRPVANSPVGDEPTPSPIHADSPPAPGDVGPCRLPSNRRRKGPQVKLSGSNQSRSLASNRNVLRLAETLSSYPMRLRADQVRALKAISRSGENAAERLREAVDLMLAGRIDSSSSASGSDHPAENKGNAPRSAAPLGVDIAKLPAVVSLDLLRAYSRMDELSHLQGGPGRKCRESAGLVAKVILAIAAVVNGTGEKS